MANTYELCLNMNDGTKRKAQFTVPSPTAEDVGAPTKEEFLVLNAGFEAHKLTMALHTTSDENPHKVTAEQVGARPDTWMPTASEVGARPDTWMPSASEVGARPNTWMPTGENILSSGLGNGNFNDRTSVGDYWMQLASCTNAPVSAGYGWLLVRSGTAGQVVQIFIKYQTGEVWTRSNMNGWQTWVQVGVFTEDTTYPGCFYRVVGSEKEWLNPPMRVGVEYRTAERWAMAPVYTILLEAGAIPNTGRTGVDFPNSNYPSRVLRVDGQISSGESLPAYWEDDKATVYASRSKIYIETNSDMWSAYAAQVQAWYTK